MSAEQIQIAAVGGVYYEKNVTQVPFGNEGMLPEGEYLGAAYEIVIGGSAANFAQMCSALDLRALFVGKVGADEYGRAVGSMLEAAGVEPSLVIDPSPNIQTNIADNYINANGKAIMAVGGTANQALHSDEVEERIAPRLSESDYLYIGGCFKLATLLPAFEDLATLAKTTDTKIVVDHGRVPPSASEETKERIRRLAQAADYYLPSVDELQILWSEKLGTSRGELLPVESIIQELGRLTRGTVVVKDGDKGALTLTNNKITRVPAFAIEGAVQPVGAGDSFNAGFIAAQYRGEDLITSISFGCATAAIKISQNSFPSVDAVTRWRNERV